MIEVLYMIYSYLCTEVLYICHDNNYAVMVGVVCDCCAHATWWRLLLIELVREKFVPAVAALAMDGQGVFELNSASDDFIPLQKC